MRSIHDKDKLQECIEAINRRMCELSGMSFEELQEMFSGGVLVSGEEW